MMNALAQLLGLDSKPKPMSLEEAQADAQRQYSPELEKLARERGFKSAHEMALFNKARQRGANQQTTQFQEAAQNAVEDTTAWHPANMFNRLAEMINGATE